jgi:methyl-galactoside transport system permease protein
MSDISTTGRRLTTRSVREFATNNAILLVLLAVVLVIGIVKTSFLNFDNIMNILRISSVRAVIALGVGGILITRGTDLSAGRTVGLAAVISGSLAQRMNYPSRLFPNMADHSIWIPVLAGIGAGLVVGLLNGTIVAFLKVPAFIATLGTMTIVYGAESLYVDRPPMGATPLGGFKDEFTNLGSGSIGPDSFSVPIIIIIAVVISVFIFLVLNKTRLGKNIYAMGGNPDAAVVSGVSIWKNTMLVYAIAGLLYGLGGVLLAARAGGATNNYGQGYELDAIAACVIGGVSVSGGIGRVSGMLVGVLIKEVMNNGLVVLGVSAYWQQIVLGLIIVVAVGIDIQKYVRKR